MHCSRGTPWSAKHALDRSLPGYHRLILRRPIALLLLALLAAAPDALGRVPDLGGSGEPVEVVVELAPPPAAQEGYGRPAERTRARAALLAVDRAQREVAGRILERIPGAEIRWRYRIVLAGLAVVVPPDELARLAATPGVIRVYPSVRYRPLLDASPAQIGAPALWGPGLENAGRGVKIGIIDDGIDASHPFFDPAGLSMPGGFPRGDRAYTTAKVIVARSFPPPGADWPYASRPFDPLYSFHGTHVAGIAAGRAGTAAPATSDRSRVSGLSGVAPLAYLGNYRALTVPTETVGLNGNSPELVAAVEAAVADGMDVINLSLGEPEVEPSRDVLARALDNAAAAGVIPVVAAGNDYDLLGGGSVASPGTADSAITVGAVTGDRFFGTAGHVVGPEPVPAALGTFGGIAAPGGVPARFGTADQRLVDALSVDPAALLCTPVPAGSLDGRLVLVPEGGCALGRKASNARAAGALTLVLVRRAPGDPLFVSPASLPVLAVSPATGARLAAFIQASGGEILVRVGNRIEEVPSEESGEIASFSAGGPTPLSLELKPDVAAPGVDILSSQPGGTFELLSGTSMAAPHVAGAAALLRERHPAWTVEQVKSALVQTASPAWDDAVAGLETRATREGGGIVDLREAAAALLFASPQTLAFGLLDVRDGPRAASRVVVLADAGGGAGDWRVLVDAPPLDGARLETPASVTVPGSLTVTAAAGPGASEGERTGFLVLLREGERRRIPFWFRVTSPRLPEVPARVLAGPGVYHGSTLGREGLVSRYRYPEAPVVVTRILRGPEQAFRFVLRRDAVNLGVAVLGKVPGVQVLPRIVLGADENRLAGAAALPYVGNPYLPTFLWRARIAGVLWPSAGVYTIVFDSPRPEGAGPFTFRLWVNDTTPPTARLVSTVVRNGRLFARVDDAGSGVDPGGIFYQADGGPWIQGVLVDGGRRAVLDVSDLPPGRHRLELRVSDRQETKNNENVTRVLPNTRVVRAAIRVP